MSQVDRNALLRGKVAFCTGTSSLGINHSIVRQWLQHGANVVLLGRRQHALDERVREFERAGYGRERVLAVPIDVRDPASLARAVALTVERFGRIDILLNGAAGNFLCRSEDLSLNAARQVFEIDTLGAFAAVKATLNELKKTQGVILNISAMLHVPQTPLQLHASMAKAGMDAMTRQLSCELGQRYGIRVIGIAPGPIEATPGMDRLSGGQDTAQMVDRIPMRRLGTGDDIANAATFLCSPLASYITGITLPVDGGESIWKPNIVPDDVYEMLRDQRLAERKKKPKAKL